LQVWGAPNRYTNPLATGAGVRLDILGEAFNFLTMNQRPRTNTDDAEPFIRDEPGDLSCAQVQELGNLCPRKKQSVGSPYFGRGGGYGHEFSYRFSMVPEPPAVGTRLTRARLADTFRPMEVPFEGRVMLRFDGLERKWSVDFRSRMPFLFLIKWCLSLGKAVDKLGAVNFCAIPTHYGQDRQSPYRASV
jgi:hypothetical protein